ncbi:MAG: HAD hydrolase family protein [Clostridia bacterium]|nr:HAD hydrolase family protein [Clostridia bacterium]
MGKYSGILLCSDFDGTFAYRGKIIPENTAAVRAFTAEGGRFTIASGRSPYEFDSFGDEVPVNAPLISLNGSVIFDRPTEILLYGGRLNDCVKAMARSVWEEFPFIGSLYFFGLRGNACFKRTDEASLDSFIAELPDVLYKGIFYSSPEDSDMLLPILAERYGDLFNFSRAGRSGIEFQDVADTKGTAARRLCEILGGIDKLVCVGDFENDIPMLKAADISFAVGGGSPKAQAVADHVTVTCEEHAVEAVIAAL